MLGHVLWTIVADMVSFLYKILVDGLVAALPGC